MDAFDFINECTRHFQHVFNVISSTWGSTFCSHFSYVVCALPKKDLSQELKNHISKVVCKYLDLKYFLRQQLPKASDVYAYSVVLLELITRQWAIDHM